MLTIPYHSVIIFKNGGVFMKKVTSTDVANLAGVSQTTVSFVLNNRTDISISEETRNKVLEAAKKLNYLPGTFSKSPKTGITKTIGLIVPNFSNMYYPMLIQNVEKHLANEGYNLLICDTNRNQADEKYYLRFLWESGVDGVIFAFTPSDYRYINSFSKKIPIVILGETDNRYKVPTIELDSIKSGGLIARHLLELGHRKIALLSTPINNISLSRSKRLSGIEKELQKYGDQVEFIVKTADYEHEFTNSAFETEIGYQLANDLLSKTKVTAIIGINDMLAFGAIEAVKDIGASVPEDIAVCGFDNLYLSKTVSPGITTVDHMISERCQNAVTVILDMLKHRNSQIIKVVYEPQLIIRKSTQK